MIFEVMTVYVTKCPICGSTPEIRDAWGPRQKQRERLCGCPRYCSVIPSWTEHLNKSWFCFKGDGDANTIYKSWNKAVARYKANEKLFPYCNIFKLDWSKWTDDEHVEMPRF